MNMMLKINWILLVVVLIGFQNVCSQSIKITGRVAGQLNLENIHVINSTAQEYTVTDNKGSFNINVTLNDTLTFSSIQHKLKAVVVSQKMIDSKTVFVMLNDQINVLDEVIIGKVLTGDLMSDIENTDGDVPINFYDVGIPGYTGKPATQSERRLAEAGAFKPIMLLGILTGNIPLNPILNGLSGRTKLLKKRVKHEKAEILMRSIKGRLFEDFFAVNPLESSLRTDFFYFCADDENFIAHCKDQSDLKILELLSTKYKSYVDNMQPNKKL